MKDIDLLDCFKCAFGLNHADDEGSFVGGLICELWSYCGVAHHRHAKGSRAFS